MNTRTAELGTSARPPGPDFTIVETSARGLYHDLRQVMPELPEPAKEKGGKPMVYVPDERVTVQHGYREWTVVTLTLHVVTAASLERIGQ